MFPSRISTAFIGCYTQYRRGGAAGEGRDAGPQLFFDWTSLRSAFMTSRRFGTGISKPFGVVCFGSSAMSRR